MKTPRRPGSALTSGRGVRQQTCHHRGGASALDGRYIVAGCTRRTVPDQHPESGVTWSGWSMVPSALQNPHTGDGGLHAGGACIRARAAG